VLTFIYRGTMATEGLAGVGEESTALGKNSPRRRSRRRIHATDPITV
jgi:hypothetical protein